MKLDISKRIKDSKNNAIYLIVASYVCQVKSLWTQNTSIITLLFSVDIIIQKILYPSNVFAA